VDGKCAMKVLVTGANGFIGSSVCSRLASCNKVIGAYHRRKPIRPANIVWKQADLTDFKSVTAICKKYLPEVVIHCAGIAHQKIGAVDSDTYMRVNSKATENLAKAAAKRNPDVYFIFLSSVSVYGEDNLNAPITEDSECQPSSDYAASKFDAERRLIALSDDETLHNLVVLRLAPVYDRDWSFNLDRRVLAPMKTAYIQFGLGSQKMSALARPNLLDFIEFLIHRSTQITDKSTQQNNLNNRRNLRINIFNVCDAKAYEFNTIIKVFKKSGIRPSRPVISVPLPVVWVATRIASCLSPNKKEWIHSCYDKLASDMVFDNEKMIRMGFKPIHSLETIFLSTNDLTQRRQDKKQYKRKL